MTETKNRFHNSKIYKIIDNAYTKTYYGSTIQTLSERMASHRRTYKLGKYGTTASEIFKEFGLDNCKIELVESVKCENQDELRKIEGKYIKENACVNKNISGRSKKEYDIDNHDKILAQRKEYRKRKPELHKKLSKQYYESHKEHIFAYQQQYISQNKDKIKERTQRYRESHRELIRLKQRERIFCECGIEYSKSNKNKHYKLQKHEDNMPKSA